MDSWLSVIGGLILLLLGAELLVRGAVSLAIRVNMSPTTAGLTIVALGTSLPELMITVQDQWSGSGNIAVGGIIGSNIFNIGAILGLSAVIFPVSIQSRTLKLEHPFLLLATGILGVMIWDGRITRVEGYILLSLTASFIITLLSRVHSSAAKKRAAQVKEVVSEFQPTNRPLYLDVFYIIAAIFCLHFGAELSVQGARALALAWGWSEYLIGLTIVALGTSAPELAVSIIAALQKRTEIAIGNIIGSCIFNITFVLGVGAAMGDLPIREEVITHDIWWLLGLGILMVPLMVRGRSLGRVDGCLLILAFVVYYYGVIVGY
ncbi:MAG: cation:H+ antiporter [Planctomycetota bacterium]|jgi:cation:H+ antiporter